MGVGGCGRWLLIVSSSYLILRQGPATPWPRRFFSSKLASPAFPGAWNKCSLPLNPHFPIGIDLQGRIVISRTHLGWGGGSEQVLVYLRYSAPALITLVVASEVWRQIGDGRVFLGPLQSSKILSRYLGLRCFTMLTVHL